MLKITGECSGGGYASTAPEREYTVELEESWRKQKEEPLLKAEQKSKQKTSVLKTVLFTIIGIAGSIALGGFVISGRIPPNAHTNDGTVLSSLGQEPGMIYGYIGVPDGGLPAIGAQ